MAAKKDVSKGIVFNIQRYSIHDGPGIRTTVFLKGCVLRCFWCQNPESQAMKPEIMLNKEACTLCGRCEVACEIGAASLSEESAAIDRKRCVGCGRCVDACPVRARVLAGKEMTVPDVLTEVLRDKPFYDNSGGGVTLSGGDPVMQPTFARNLLAACKGQGLHTCIETCGLATWTTMRGLLDYTDLVLFDLKSLDPAKHRRATGKDNRVILENARRIAKLRKITIRMPLIPGFNDSPGDVTEILSFVKDGLGLASSSLHLLRYNQLGEAKFDRLGREGMRPAMQPQPQEYIEELEAIIKAG